ncbi:hypothetical protein [Candidatus Nitrosopumilus sediminis]|uniref:Uncharacterized protein n=1 Tax=Candidatus Nitrosopumilus sediminis TaxID=1229909 RepID=K0BEC8_9ARCH|nr:hypothetical protein [Candidatus Nitrosopumilus sediminis]AFS83377.1 hypothetical protein NSED_07925 [Candidatus Nitrosopumilus sediminis]
MTGPKGFDPDSRRSMVMNVTQLVRQLLDGYEQREEAKSHWLQKDGIQNCWDARKDAKKGNKWKCVIELIEENGKSFLTITDYGTWGLTGKRLSQKELETEDQPVHERWSRFENLAFANDDIPDKELLGSRGRGKFIFIGISLSNQTFYETLRDDGVYRLGNRILEKTDSPTVAEEGEKAREILKQNTGGLLKPLNHVGTRIIIPDPDPEVVKDFKDGHMEEFIGDTWWEIIEKFNAEIILKDGKNERKVNSFFSDIPKKPKNKNQKILIKENIMIHPLDLRIKKIFLFYDKERTFDERYRGIAVQRAGMNICRLSLEELGPNLSTHITGYVTCERNFDHEMRRCEGQEHYDFMWNRIPARYLKALLIQEYRKFAEEQLGWRALKAQKAQQGQKNAESRALRAANRVAKDIGFGRGGTKVKKPQPPGPPRPKPHKEIQIQLDNPVFPDSDTMRVNYDQSLKSIKARISNNSKHDIQVKARIVIKSVERGDVIEHIYKSDIDVKSNTTSEYFGKDVLKITKQDYSPGHYKISADIVLLTPFEKLRKGYKLDKSEISFYVEQDPPEGGVFEEFVRVVDFDYLPEPKDKLRCVHVMGSKPNTYKLEYNGNHNDCEEYGKEEDTLSQYLYRLSLPELCSIDIENEWKLLFKDSDIIEPIRVIERTNEIIGEFTTSTWMAKI